MNIFTMIQITQVDHHIFHRKIFFFCIKPTLLRNNHAHRTWILEISKINFTIMMDDLLWTLAYNVDKFKKNIFLLPSQNFFMIQRFNKKKSAHPWHLKLSDLCFYFLFIFLCFPKWPDFDFSSSHARQVMKINVPAMGTNWLSYSIENILASHNNIWIRLFTSWIYCV